MRVTGGSRTRYSGSNSLNTDFRRAAFDLYWVRALLLKMFRSSASTEKTTTWKTTKARRHTDMSRRRALVLEVEQSKSGYRGLRW